MSHLQLDEIRKEILPESRQIESDRDTTYRAMHFAAEELLKVGASVILDATYSRSRPRAGAERLARRAHKRIFLIQCRVPPEVAVIRFAKPRRGHGAVDLSQDRVSGLAQEFRYFEDGAILDSVKSVSVCVRRATQFVESGHPISSDGKWSSSAK